MTGIVEQDVFVRLDNPDPIVLKMFSSQSVSTSASGCAYWVGLVAIGREISVRLRALATDLTRSDSPPIRCMKAKIDNLTLGRAE